MKGQKMHCPFLFFLISHNIFVSFDNMDKAKSQRRKMKNDRKEEK